MKKRNVRKDDPPSVQKSAKVHQQKKEKTAKSWKKIILLLLLAGAMLGFSLTILPELIQQFLFMYRIRLPLFVDLSQPADFSLNHTVNMYLTSEEDISLGVWHTVPESQWKEAQGKDLDWYQKTLSNGSPVFIYLHGNTKNRAAPHRIGVSQILSTLGYHVLVPDYRGFGDSTGEPTEDGLSTDAIYIYNWVKARSGNSLIVLWGHSLGTGVSTNIAVKLLKKGVIVDGVILEGAFNSAQQKMNINPFLWFYWSLPGVTHLFKGSWKDLPVFPTEENVKKMESPILFLHSEDDHLVPIEIAEQLYEVAASAQNKDRVKLVTFDGSKGYLHNGLYRDAKLPGVIKNFVESL